MRSSVCMAKFANIDSLSSKYLSLLYLRACSNGQVFVVNHWDMSIPVQCKAPFMGSYAPTAPLPLPSSPLNDTPCGCRKVPKSSIIISVILENPNGGQCPAPCSRTRQAPYFHNNFLQSAGRWRSESKHFSSSLIQLSVCSKKCLRCLTQGLV